MPRRGSAAINSRRFYGEYHGHLPEHLEAVHASVLQDRGAIYLVGDSTLDNKYWIHDTRPACNGYEGVLSPPRSTPDVAHALNAECVERGVELCAINAAVEESTLGQRTGGRSVQLLPQDEFVREHITERDVLVVSCGGNDIALRPTRWTMASIAALLLCPKFLISSGLAPGLGHFVRLFRDATREYVEALTRERRPRCVVVCMLYYLDVEAGGSWADGTLSMLGYDKDPSKLQLIMRAVFERATREVRVDGVESVLAVPLYEALDGSDTSDYVQRVEPSEQGGRKMARLLMDRLHAAGVLSKV